MKVFLTMCAKSHETRQFAQECDRVLESEGAALDADRSGDSASDELWRTSFFGRGNAFEHVVGLEADGLLRRLKV